MFGMLESLTKAAVSVVVAPIALAVDAVMIPIDAVEGEEAFKRTKDALNCAAQNLNDAVKPISK